MATLPKHLMGTSREISFDEIRLAWQRVTRILAEEQTEDGHWTGQLSTSALSTATAVSALVLMRRHGAVPTELKVEVDESIEIGCRWLLDAQNADGGFGDTDLSYSNIATTLLVLSAWKLTGFDQEHAAKFDSAQTCAEKMGKWEALRTRYGKDKTFVVPILTNCALAGLVEWTEIPALPFEAAWLPQSWYRLAQMPVVSYAIPALVAMGQAKFYHSPPRNLIVRAVRTKACEPTLQVLARMQPSSGGYLEAVPLTSFVLMSLASIGKGMLPVSQRCMRFLLDSRLENGSWPIDTNLATWVTSLSICAIGRRSPSDAGFPVAEGERRCLKEETEGTNWGEGTIAIGEARNRELISAATIRWLLSCQHLARHPFTGALPGGWGWTNLSGAVPDADDTPAALIALSIWYRKHAGQFPILDRQIHKSVAAGLQWLVRLQNRDGGWPTFCRGWGKLPFDRSGTDLTAHALRAIEAWRGNYDGLRASENMMPSSKILDKAQKKGLAFLSRQQRSDGSWLPLWFGNQDCSNDENPVYGTSRVLLVYTALGIADHSESKKGLLFLETSQNGDGGWGGGVSVPYRVPGLESAALGSSIEETSVALESMLLCGSGEAYSQTTMRGLRWLVSAVDSNCSGTSWPIGFYFAKLWYHERLYPAIFSSGALGTALAQWEHQEKLAEKIVRSQVLPQKCV